MSGVERNLDRLFDQNEILEELYRYCSAADRNEPAGMLEAFVDECVVCYDPTLGPMHGKQALSDMLYSFLGAVISGSHYITNPLFDFVAPDEVLFGCYMYSWQRFTAHPEIEDVHRFGRYEMRWLRVDGRWRISSLNLFSAGEYGGVRIGEHMGRLPTPLADFLHTFVAKG